MNPHDSTETDRQEPAGVSRRQVAKGAVTALAVGLFGLAVREELQRQGDAVASDVESERRGGRKRRRRNRRGSSGGRGGSGGSTLR